MIYFTSDTHYNHSNMVSGTSKWSDISQCRQFKTLEDHDQWLVTEINKIVKHDDTLIHGGDWSFGGIDNILKFRNQLNCRHIIITCGNHDHHFMKHKSMFDPHFDLIIPHMNSFYYYSGKQDFIVQHYAQRTWYRANKGSWMLYGHSHGNLNDGFSEKKYKTMDIGVDNLMKVIGRPVISFTEISDIFSKRELLHTDHHDHTTNDK